MKTVEQFECDVCSKQWTAIGLSNAVYYCCWCGHKMGAEDISKRDFWTKATAAFDAILEERGKRIYELARSECFKDEEFVKA